MQSPMVERAQSPLIQLLKLLTATGMMLAILYIVAQLLELRPVGFSAAQKTSPDLAPIMEQALPAKSDNIWQIDVEPIATDISIESPPLPSPVLPPEPAREEMTIVQPSDWSTKSERSAVQFDGFSGMELDSPFGAEEISTLIHSRTATISNGMGSANPHENIVSGAELSTSNPLAGADPGSTGSYHRSLSYVPLSAPAKPKPIKKVLMLSPAQALAARRKPLPKPGQVKITARQFTPSYIKVERIAHRKPVSCFSTGQMQKSIKIYKAGQEANSAIPVRMRARC